MKRRGAANSAAGISMFPFLAVLLCTMGALLVLLVAVARQARVHALEAMPQEVDEELEFQLATARWRIDALKESRDKTAGQLADVRLVLSHLEEHARRLRNEVAQLAGVAQQMESADDVDADMRTLWQRQIAQLDAEILHTRAEIDEASRQRRSSSYAIIPYRGPNETSRRPIYIECRKDTIVLQPEGIVLHEDDFPVTMGPGNPLAAVVRSATEQINEQRRAGGYSPGDPNSGSPYPLLLVRPDGIAAYYAARSALSSWDQEFGYELVEQDWELAYPPADGSLSAAMQLALREARLRQQVLLAASPRVRSGQSFRIAPGRGGAIAERDPLGGLSNDGGGAGSFQQGGFGSRFGADSTRSGGTGGAEQVAAGNMGGRYGENTESLTAGDGNHGPYAGGSAAPQGSDLTSGQWTEGAGATGSQGTWQQAGSEQGAASGNGPSFAAASTAQGANAGTTQQASGAQGEATPGQSYAGGQPGGAAATGAGAPNSLLSQQLESLANTRGSNWGLPKAASGSVPVTRPIRIQCQAGALTFLGRNVGGQTGQTIPLGFRTESSVDQLVSAVWSQIDTWGIAGQGMYWRPILSFEVLPGGEDRFRDLQVLLEGSGLIVEGPATTATAQPSAYPTTRGY